MGLLNIIRRMHKRQKLSIREIARLTGVSRNTVTKHLSANTIEPRFATPERQSKIDPFADKLAGWLKTGVPPLKWSTHWDMTIPLFGGPEDGWKAREAGRHCFEASAG